MRARRAAEAGQSRWGDLLRDIREEQGISQRQLAKMAKVNRNALRNAEKGEGPCTMELMEKVMAALGYEFDVHHINGVLNRE
jgi:transcriptional regulator with XRE-family HTH domain